MAQLLGAATLVLSDGSKVKAEDYLKDKVVALYFSAGWCPPCRAFTPKLKKYYEALKAQNKNFEVVFVSRDREADSLLEYYRDHHGAWTYLEFGDAKIAELLAKFETSAGFTFPSLWRLLQTKIKTIPALKVIKPDGSVVVNDARTEVQDKGVVDPAELYEEWLCFYNI